VLNFPKIHDANFFVVGAPFAPADDGVHRTSVWLSFPHHPGAAEIFFLYLIAHFQSDWGGRRLFFLRCGASFISPALLR